MAWHDITFLKYDANKANQWKKATTGRIRFHPNETAIEIDVINSKKVVNEVVMKEADDERKTPYLLFTFGKGDLISVTSRKEFLNLLFSAIKMVMGSEFSNEAVQSKIQEFQKMLEQAKDFLSSSEIQSVPPIPSAPPTNFSVELPPEST